VLVDLMPDEAEARGLLALMLLQHSRRSARTDGNGDIVLLEDQDRTRWDRSMIIEGVGLVDRGLRRGAPGMYLLQATIASVHARAQSFAATDWTQIVGLYDRLVEHHASPVIELNRAVAVAMSRGPDAGLELLDGVVADGRLDQFHLLYATRAELLRRADRLVEARATYELALAQKQAAPERRYLEKRLAELRAE
jgi:RNA polymerase sigma-70 factor, ECF subfamily